MWHPSLYRPAFLLAAVSLFTGCGTGSGTGGGNATTASGILKDANISGLSYRSGDEEGETGSDGRFTYEVGRDVTFSVGDLVVGTAPGQPVITPLDFSPAGRVDSTVVQNIVRFLLWLDTDAISENGIEISQALRAHAEATPSIWKPVAFNVSEGDFNAELNLLFFDMNQFRGARSLPTGLEARAHLTDTLQCLRSGAFRGTLAGDDTGHLGVMVDAQTNALRGFIARDGGQALIALDGASPVSLDQQAFFISNATVPDTLFMGRLLDPDTLTGSWTITVAQALEGTFQGERIGGNDDTRYRYTATYENGAADAAGLYTFDINAAGAVTGVAYGVDTDQETTLSGVYDSATASLIAVTPGQAVRIEATVNLTAGTLNGGDSLGNTVTGSGCRLN
ncbi:MAG: hypothetical protein IT489_01640 [Gammaproteobacteria bacterium]|nr:hypothetical protein [Gammaproteobacteria bacterium]